MLFCCLRRETILLLHSLCRLRILRLEFDFSEVVMVKLRDSLLLFLAALIWGVTFVGQSDAMKYIEPFTFNFLRCVIGALVLLPFSIAGEHKRLKNVSETEKKAELKALFIGGLLCGLTLFAAMNLQQHGIQKGDSIGKAGFITSIYMILVPIIGIFFKKKTNILIWISAVIAFAGLYLLCGTKEGFKFELSDILFLLCSVFFALHILLISNYAPRVSGTALSCVQFVICAILSCIAMFIFESPSIKNILAAYIPLLYAGVMACGVAYTLQVVGQRHLDPTVATLILCLESVISVLAGWIFLDQTLTTRQIIGCAVMFVGTTLAQIPIEKFKKKKAKA